MVRLGKKAFSLIESAIVLGVVGLVIGGIWVTAATVRENMLANELAKGFLYIKHETQNQIMMSQVPLTIQESYYNSATLGGTLGLAPADWIQSNGKIITPSGQGINMGTYDDSGVPTATFSFSVSASKPMSDFPPSLCVKVLTKVLAADGQTWAVVNGCWIYKAPNNTREVKQITAYCNAAGTHSFSGMSLRFPLTRPN